MSVDGWQGGPPLLGDSWGVVPPQALDPQVRVEEWVERERRFIRAEIPGVDPRRDIELSVDGGLLHLRGERRFHARERHRTEFRYGTFSRVVSLPPGTRPEDITAEYANGVLTVSMPEVGARGSTTIPVWVRSDLDADGDTRRATRDESGPSGRPVVPHPNGTGPSGGRQGA